MKKPSWVQSHPSSHPNYISGGDILILTDFCRIPASELEDLPCNVLHRHLEVRTIYLQRYIMEQGLLLIVGVKADCLTRDLGL